MTGYMSASLAAHGAVLVLVEPLEHLLNDANFKAASIFSLVSIFYVTKYIHTNMPYSPP